MVGQEHNEFDELERQLAAMKPSDSRVDRAELLFRAGQASVPSSDRAVAPLSWLWPLSTALLAVVSVGLSWQLHNVGEPQIVERIRYVPTQTEMLVDKDAREYEADSFVLTSHSGGSSLDRGQDSSVERNHYVQQRRLALSMGLDALGDPQTQSVVDFGGISTYRDLKTNYWTHDPSSSAVEGTHLLNERL